MPSAGLGAAESTRNRVGRLAAGDPGTAFPLLERRFGGMGGLGFDINGDGEVDFVVGGAGGVASRALEGGGVVILGLVVLSIIFQPGSALP